MREKLINGAYKGILLFAVVITILVGTFSKCSAQTPNEVYEECLNNNIEHPEIVLRQSILETGWYNCDQCALRYNNIFGFRLSSLATEENPKGYLKFEHWKDCVKYYAKWQRKWYKGENYYTFLENIGYATSETYIEKLKNLNIPDIKT